MKCAWDLILFPCCCSALFHSAQVEQKNVKKLEPFAIKANLKCLNLNMDNTFVILMMFCRQPHLKKDWQRTPPPPESLSPSATEITIDWWSRIVVCSAALQSIPTLTSSYQRNSAWITKMKWFEAGWDLRRSVCLFITLPDIQLVCSEVCWRASGKQTTHLKGLISFQPLKGII